MTEHPLLDTVRQSPGCPAHCICTAAFSGGADSTALLHCLFVLQTELAIDLRAVHVHHGIRGAEADRDAAFCKAFCAQYGIPFQCVHVDVPAFAAEKKCSVETAARMLRYEALEASAPEGVIVTAHHAGDQAETVLFHLLRGSGMNGLCGIPPKNGRIFRPLLHAEKSGILDYLRQAGLDFVEDSTNFDSDSSRNRLRQEIIPLLMRENPAAVRHIARTAMLLSGDEALLRQLAEDAYLACFDTETGGLSGLTGYPQPIRMRVYMRRLQSCPKSVHIDPSYAQLSAVDAIVQQGSGSVNLSGDVYARTERGILYMQEESALAAQLPMQIGDNRLYPGRICTAQICEKTAVSQNVHTENTKVTLDFDKIIGTPCFRQRRASDRITLPARNFSSLLKKCVQAEVPGPLRSVLYTLYDDSGCIWCERVGAAARVKPDQNSRRLLTLHVRAAETIQQKKE